MFYYLNNEYFAVHILAILILSLPSWYHVISCSNNIFINRLRDRIITKNSYELTFWLSSSRFSCSSFFLSFLAISSSLNRDTMLRRRSRRSGGPSPNKPFNLNWKCFDYKWQNRSLNKNKLIVYIWARKAGVDLLWLLYHL